MIDFLTVALPTQIRILRDLRVFRNVVSRLDHDLLLRLCAKKLRRLPFRDTHFDGVIQGYRESSVSDWRTLATDPADSEHAACAKGDNVARILSSVYAVLHHAQQEYDRHGSSQQTRAPTQWLNEHILELKECGSIGPHIDSLTASGEIVAALSLISPTPIIFRHKDDPLLCFKLLAEPCSLYVQRGFVRYNFTHEIPSSLQDRSFKDTIVPCGRRISIMFRDKISPPLSSPLTSQ